MLFACCMNHSGLAKRGAVLVLRIALSLLAVGLSSCHDDPGDRILEQSFERICQVDPDARVTVRNVDGSIRLYGAKIREVRIQAIKKAYSQERLDKIAINVTAQANSVSIDTIYPPKPKFSLTDRSGTVDYIIVVPENSTIPRLELVNGELLIEGMRGGKVSANLVNGRLFDHNGFGAHQLFVANGGLDVVYDWWEAGAFSIDAKIVNGNARAFIPGEAAFHLLARTVDGNIASDFSEKEERNRELVQKIDAVVGGPSQAVIQIQATNGSIQIAEANP
jgi:hypothetical protein